MHELALAESLLSVIREEMLRHKAVKLKRVVLHHGALANVVPEALQLAFTALTAEAQDTPSPAGAVLEMHEIPLRLACGGCAHEFSPEKGLTALLASCPVCAEQLGHTVLSGKGIVLDHLEME